jgi:hypothetical protein
MTLAQIKHLTPSYTHLNQSSRVEAACKEHTAFKPADFAPGTNLFVVEVGEIVFDYNGMSHQPRLGNIDPNTVKRYTAQAEEGVNGVLGIRKPITVYCSNTHKKFVGIKGHHRFKTASKIGYQYMVVEIDDNFVNLTKANQVDYLMSDNAFADNGLQSCVRSVTEALKATLQDETFMQAERTIQAQLQKKLTKTTDPVQRKEMSKQIKALDKKVRVPLETWAQKWNPSGSRKNNKSLVTKALNNHKAKHLVQVYNHSRDERKEYITADTASLGSNDLHFDWGQQVTNNNVQINLPVGEFMGKIRAFKKANKGILPDSFTFYTHIPGGVKDYHHLFELRKRIQEDILDRVADVYQTVPRQFKFLGQILNNNSKWVENHKGLYGSSRVAAYFNKLEE